MCFTNDLWFVNKRYERLHTQKIQSSAASLSHNLSQISMVFRGKIQHQLYSKKCTELCSSWQWVIVRKLAVTQLLCYIHYSDTMRHPYTCPPACEATTRCPRALSNHTHSRSWDRWSSGFLDHHFLIYFWAQPSLNEHVSYRTQIFLCSSTYYY